MLEIVEHLPRHVPEETHNMTCKTVRIANREDPDQTASKESDPGLCCLSRPFSQVTSFQNFRTFSLRCYQI